MADEIWTLNFYMKDAPSGEKFLVERMDKDLICYFDIIGLIEKQGYTSMDYLYCKRKCHGRRQSELVEIISDTDVSRMVCEHEVDQKLSFHVMKQIDGLNTGIRRCGQVHIASNADAERHRALSDEGVNGSGYETEESHETDREAERGEQQSEMEAMKRRGADPNVNWVLVPKKETANGELSPEDYDKVFDDVIAKESTIGGYYDEKYWGDAKLFRDSTSVQGSSSDARVQKQLQEVKDDFKKVTWFMERMQAFMARNHPDEDWVNEVMNPGNEIKTGGQPEEHLAPMLQSNNISVNINSDKVGGGYDVDGVEEPMDNVHTTESDPKEAQFGNNPTSNDLGNITGKASTRKESPEQTSHQVNVSKRANNVGIRHKVTETAGSNEAIQTSSKNTKCARATKDKEHCQNSFSAHEERFVKKPKIVVLVSLAPRTKDLVVGKGVIKSRDSNYVVQGDTLGDSYWAITVLHVSKLGRERLPRPFGDIQTVQDAIGQCIAWPSTHVKRVKDDSN